MLSGVVPIMWTPSLLQRNCKVERRLSTELDDHSIRFFFHSYIKHILKSKEAQK